MVCHGLIGSKKRECARPESRGDKILCCRRSRCPYISSRWVYRDSAPRAFSVAAASDVDPQLLGYGRVTKGRPSQKNTRSLTQVMVKLPSDLNPQGMQLSGDVRCGGCCIGLGMLKQPSSWAGWRSGEIWIKFNREDLPVVSKNPIRNQSMPEAKKIS